MDISSDSPMESSETESKTFSEVKKPAGFSPEVSEVQQPKREIKFENKKEIQTLSNPHSISERLSAVDLSRIRISSDVPPFAMVEKKWPEMNAEEEEEMLRVNRLAKEADAE